MGLLPDRSVIRVTGDDTPKLLDDTLTGRFQGPMGLEGRWFALLSPQGKIQIEGIATEADAAIWLDIPKSAAEAFLKRMKLYRLRAKVDFEDVSADTAVWWTAGNEGPKTRWAISYSDNRNALVGPGKERALGRRWLVPRPEIDVGSDASGAFAAARIAAGIAELGADFAPDTLFPHDIGMDLLGGVDFKKGCYIGQEVVSRMQHRGTARRRPVIVEGTTAPSGTPILVAGRDSGQVGRAVDGRAIGIVRLDRFDGGEVTVDGKPVTITLPDWATYRLGESAVAD